MSTLESINEIPNEVNFINTKQYNIEKDFLSLKKFKKIYTNNFKNKAKYLTLNPQFYFKNKNNKNLNLLIYSIDKDNSHLLNLIDYIKFNKLKKVIYNKKYFRYYLYKKFPKRKIYSRFFILNFIKSFGVEIFKYKLGLKNLWYPKFFIRENTFNGYKIGLSDYNCYIQKNKIFYNDFKYVYSHLSNKESKKIYKTVIFSNPSAVWKIYYDSLFNKEHYQDYLNFRNSNIMNLGVDSGSEIPFFLSKNIKKIINVDPTGYKNLDEYVKIFCRRFKKKIIFDNSYLYNSSNVRMFNTNKFSSTNLNKLIKKYKLKKNIIIKSDIEGLEFRMLDEIKYLVKKCRPQLAISIYHNDYNLSPIISHITLIPKKLIKICKNYKFFIKHYSHNKRETVFFCIPNEKILNKY